jgi:Flp pilus assembly protein TadB
MRYRDDPILKAKATEQSAQELQPDAKRQRRRRSMLGALGAPWYPSQTDTGGSAHGARLLLVLVMLGFILGIGAYLLFVNR